MYSNKLDYPGTPWKLVLVAKQSPNYFTLSSLGYFIIDNALMDLYKVHNYIINYKGILMESGNLKKKMTG